MYTIHKERKRKRISDSAINDHKIHFFEENMSIDQLIFGGRILNLVHDVAAEVASKHAEMTCLTIGIDFIRYYSLIKHKDVLVCSAQVNHVWDNKIEVGVKVIAEDFRSLEQRKILSAYFIFMAKSTKEEIEIPQIILENDLDKKRYLEAEKRRKIREKRKIF